MAQKNVCSVPRSWDLVEYRKHACNDSSHRHYSVSEIQKLERRGLVVWLFQPDKSQYAGGVCQILDHVAEVEKIFDQSSFGAGSPVNTGLSFRVGEYHAWAIEEKHEWAQVMYANIKRKTHIAVDVIVAAEITA